MLPIETNEAIDPREKQDESLDVSNDTTDEKTDLEDDELNDDELLADDDAEEIDEE